MNKLWTLFAINGILALALLVGIAFTQVPRCYCVQVHHKNYDKVTNELDRMAGK